MLIRYVVVVAFFLVSLRGAGDDRKTDLDRIQGSWNGTKLEVEGKSAPVEFVRKGKYVFKGNELTIFEGGKNVGKATFAIGPVKQPKTIDITATEGPGKGKTMYGIYRIEGDTLTLCIGKERPTEFNGEGKAGLLQFKRAKSKERLSGSGPTVRVSRSAVHAAGPATELAVRGAHKKSPCQ